MYVKRKRKEERKKGRGMPGGILIPIPTVTVFGTSLCT
jgi:hypothetical protein